MQWGESSVPEKRRGSPERIRLAHIHARQLCNSVKSPPRHTKTYVTDVTEQAICSPVFCSSNRATEPKMYDDEWMTRFTAKAAPRLKALFEADVDEPSLRLEELLQKLRERETRTAALPLAA